MCMLYNFIICYDMQMCDSSKSLLRGDYITFNLPSLDIHSPEATATNTFKRHYSIFTRVLGHCQRNARSVSLVNGVAAKMYELTLVNYTITSILAWAVFLESLRSPVGSVTFRTGNLGLDWAPLVAQMVKNLPAMQETQVWSLAWEGALEKGMATSLSLSASVLLIRHWVIHPTA